MCLFSWVDLVIYNRKIHEVVIYEKYHYLLIILKEIHVLGKTMTISSLVSPSYIVECNLLKKAGVLKKTNVYWIELR